MAGDGGHSGSNTANVPPGQGGRGGRGEVRNRKSYCRERKTTEFVDSDLIKVERIQDRRLDWVRKSV